MDAAEEAVAGGGGGGSEMDGGGRCATASTARTGCVCADFMVGNELCGTYADTTPEKKMMTKTHMVLAWPSSALLSLSWRGAA